MVILSDDGDGDDGGNGNGGDGGGGTASTASTLRRWWPGQDSRGSSSFAGFETTTTTEAGSRRETFFQSLDGNKAAALCAQFRTQLLLLQRSHARVTSCLGCAGV